MIALDTVAPSQFEARLQETFFLVLKDGKFPLQLVEVRHLRKPSPDAPRQPFATLWRSATPIRLPQATYRLENEQLGAMDVFLVQITPTDIEAIFN